MDIMHDRAGYYICWGCLVWVPSVYTSPALYLVAHPVALGTPLALGMFTAGVVAVYINWDSDRQRVNFRASDGKELVWGAKPISITAHYTTGDGVKKTSKLLASGGRCTDRCTRGVSALSKFATPFYGLECWTRKHVKYRSI